MSTRELIVVSVIVVYFHNQCELVFSMFILGVGAVGWRRLCHCGQCHGCDMLILYVICEMLVVVEWYKNVVFPRIVSPLDLLLSESVFLSVTFL